MLGAVGSALAAIPDALALGIQAMGFGAAAFRRVGAGGSDRDLALLVVYLAGVSQAVGHGVVLFLNEVPRLRFVLSLALMGAIYLAGAMVTAAAALTLDVLVVGHDLAFLPTIAVIALAHAPRLLGFLTMAPYFGELFDRLLDVWILTLTLYGLHHGVGLPIGGAALLSLLGWAAIHILSLVLGRPMTVVVMALRRVVAGGPLTLDPRDMVETLKDRARAADDRGDPDR